MRPETGNSQSWKTHVHDYNHQLTITRYYPISCERKREINLHKSYFLMTPCIDQKYWPSNLLGEIRILSGGRLGSRRWRRTWLTALSLGEAYAAFEPRISEWDFLLESERIRNAGNWNILVPAGKEINWDLVSKSDWKPIKANRMSTREGVRMWCLDQSLNFLTWKLEVSWNGAP